MRLMKKRFHQGMFLGSMVLIALLAFEMFNFSTTEFALNDLLGDLSFLGLRWSTILAIAFCGIDFAGIARLFTPDETGEESTETWYLFGAWFLAASMNALLTWWGVSVALLEHVPQGTGILGRKTLLTIVPVFVALMVWLVRVLLIGTIVMTGPRLFDWHWGKQRVPTPRPTAARPSPVRTTSRLASASGYSAARSTVHPRNGHVASRTAPPPEEPTYEPLAAAAGPKGPKIV